ncbi:MAG TPA: methionine--tRNA ligase [Armatimonadota bacterium]|nr:methionine--tRNA ligase [Armatimonadota bacterium]
MSDKTFFITTAIYYVTDIPHVGSASEAIAADVMARFKRLQGCKVLFSTGTDENAIKVAEAAREQGVTPQEFVDSIVPRWVEAWNKLHISYDDFIRTTEPRHRKVTEEAFKKLMARGDIYKDVYKGWYCVSDETFFRETEVVGGLCPNPECRRPVRWVEEENYFFRLSAYADRLLEYIEGHPDFLGPEFRKNEVVSFIKAGLRDACITRAAYGWGIPVPGDPDKVIYVWFDAVLNYLTVAGYLLDDELFASTWPADVQLVGKDIFVRFHSTFWPAMLMGLEVPLPAKIFGHGFWTMEGEKMSKSRGNVISPIKLAEDLAQMSGAEFDVAVDAIRYFLMREVSFGLDGDFSIPALVGRFNADLANDLGNLLNRTLPLLQRHRNGIIPKPDLEDRGARILENLVTSTAEEVAGYMDRLQFSEALGAIWTLVGRANKYMEEQAPWKLAKDESCAARLDTVLYAALETVRATAILVQPFMPSVSGIIWNQLGIEEPLPKQTWMDAGMWGKLRPGTQTREPKPIFPRIDMKAITQPPKEEEKVEQISFDEFKKMELRVGTITAADRVPGADKLLQLTVDLGAEQRPVVAGIAQWYAPEDLVGKQIVVVANLAPATIRGVESRGMLLAADVNGTAVLLGPDKEVPAGSGVR